ncbi:Rieske Fe-S protein [Nocardia transvalensis]|uniref:Rieske Fe-S protein n=1 Tax=Nocardia transvalensis TaxID=37333 RepID=A0A7W9UFN5_9NOCA|nr:Rieske (2Fe-2S) protein [Nocardia transvalensis]MBB5911191.1 Rieske Fe-S protein [Nocardia transvalensis]
MTERDVERYVEDLLAGRRPRGFRPDDAEAEELRAAIGLRAARLGSDAPSEEFLSGLHRRLADETGSGPVESGSRTTRRVVLIGSSVAAAAAAGGVIDHALVTGTGAGEPAAQERMTPNNGTWRAVAATADLPEGGTLPFDTGTVTGFVRRQGGVAVAVSGVCTHQGCKLWLDAPADRLRCPCHSTSFTTAGQVVTHQLPIAPAPLPELRVREIDGAIEVFVPAEHA